MISGKLICVSFKLSSYLKWCVLKNLSTTIVLQLIWYCKKSMIFYVPYSLPINFVSWLLTRILFDPIHNYYLKSWYKQYLFYFCKSLYYFFILAKYYLTIYKKHRAVNHINEYYNIRFSFTTSNKNGINNWW